MGIAWIANILIFDVNLLFIAYIMTTFIADQGIIIFILFLPLSKTKSVYHFGWQCSVLMCVGEAGKPKVVEQQNFSILIPR